MNWLPRQRYLAGFTLAALILACVGAGVIVAANRYSASSDKVAHSYDVIGRITGIEAMLFDSIALNRNYLLTGEPLYLARYRAIRPTMEVQLAALANLDEGKPANERAIDELARLLNLRLATLDGIVDAYEPDGLAAAQAYIKSNNGQEQTERIRELSMAAIQSERALLNERALDSRRNAWFLYGTGALAIPLSMLILVWIYFFLSREVRERQRAIRDSQDANLRLADSVHDLERVGMEMRELSRSGNQLQSCRHIPEALSITSKTLRRLAPDCAGTVYLLRESQDHAEAEASWGEHVVPSEPVLQPVDCWGLRRGQGYLVEDHANGIACDHAKAVGESAADATCSSLCLPLVSHGVQLGMLYLSAPPSGLLPNVIAVTSAAEQLSLALGNLRLEETLRHQSIRDPLTGLYNRRYLQESLHRELARCSRRGLPLSVLMLDLDHFKALNDQNGHDGGDAVLSAFGRLLQSGSREEDIACRYGGEEFVLIMPEAGLDAARRRAEEIRAAVEAMSVRHLHRDLGPVTVSIGVATHPDHASSANLLTRIADEALYRAKHAGRNRVEVAGTD